jgi:ParB family chromosome partitioning protein
VTDLATPPATELLDLPLVRIHPAADNPRRTFDETALEELAESIRAQGVLQPVVVTPDRDADGDYELVAGERRWRAGKLADLDTIPCVVRHFPDPVTRAMAMLTENLQRSDLDPIDEAVALQRLVKELKVSQRDIAGRLGCSQSHVAKRLKLTELPDEARTALVDGRLTIGQALDLAGLKDKVAVAKIVAGDGKVNPYDIEHAVKKQEREALRAKAEKAFADSGLKEAPNDASWSGDWKKLKSADGATHAMIVGGDLVYYRKKTKAEKEPKPAKATGPGPSSTPAPTVGPTADEVEAERRLAVWASAERQRRTWIHDHLAGIAEDNAAAVDEFLAASVVALVGDVDLRTDADDAGGYWEYDARAEVTCELLDIEAPGWHEMRGALGLHFIGAHLSDKIGTAIAVALSGFIGMEHDYHEIPDGNGFPAIPAIYERFLLHAGYPYGPDEKAELIRIGYLVDDSDDLEPAPQAEAETTGEDPAPSPVVDAPDTSTPASPDSALVQADEAGDEEPTLSSPPADPDDDLPKASDDRAERLNLAKAETKALKAWTAGGETGPRPHTPNLDVINGTRV